MRDNGVLSDDEFTAAKAKQLATTAPGIPEQREPNIPK
jgi:hypothetical protein